MLTDGRKYRLRLPVAFCCRTKAVHHVRKVPPIHPVLLMHVRDPIDRRWWRMKETVNINLIISASLIHARSAEFPAFLIGMKAYESIGIFFFADFATGFFGELRFHHGIQSQSTVSRKACRNR
jgi:hypothetical protein